MERRQSLFEILFVAASVIYFGTRIGFSDSVETIEGDVLRPIELAQSEGMKERAERIADEVLGSDQSHEDQDGDQARSIASIADAATSVRLYASPLFNESARDIAGDLDRHVIRRRAVVPNETLLRDRVAVLKNERLAELSDDYRSLPLNMFPDAEFLGVIDEITPSLKGGYVITGHVQDENESSLAMVYENNTLIADVAVGRDRYELRYLQDTYVAQQIDSSRVDAHTNLSDAQLLNDISEQVDAAGGPSTAGPIHVNVIYSSAVKIAQGSRASAEGNIQLTVARLNRQLTKSGADREIRLLSVKEGPVSPGGFQIATVDPSVTRHPQACGLEIFLDEETVWSAGEMVEVRWHSSDVDGPLEVSLVSPDGSVQSLGMTENDGQIQLLVPKTGGSNWADGYILRLQSPSGCVVESRSIRIR